MGELKQLKRDQEFLEQKLIEVGAEIPESIVHDEQYEELFEKIAKKYGEQKGVSLTRLNWEETKDSDLALNRGFIVREKAFTKETKNMEGMHSPRFSTDWEDEDAFAERYRCECGKLTGRLYEGDICKHCKKPVLFKDIDLRMTAWIDLGDYKIIHPIYYKFLKSGIGKGQFEEIINFVPEYTVDGGIQTNKKPKSPFASIGLIEFYNRFEEIIEYYKRKNKKAKNKLMVLNICLQEKDAVFSSFIPVYHAELRPVSFKGESFAYGKADRLYNTLYSQSVLLRDNDSLNKRKNSAMRKSGEEKERSLQRLTYPSILANIQSRLMALWDVIFEQINSKEGQVRNQVLGGKVDYSGRSVIIPDPTLKPDEIRICYLTMLELCRYEIIGYLSALRNISISEANDIWAMARIKFDENIYQIMVYMVNNKRVYFDINRNPTINYGSYLTLRCVEVKRDLNTDYTMSLSLAILTILNADFDGDTLNQFLLKGLEFIRFHDEAFNPSKNMFISRNNGLFNTEMNLIKDEIIGLWQFNNI